MYNTKEYKPLLVPEQSSWDKPNYDPIAWIYNLRGYREWPDWIEKWFFDPYFNIKSSIRNFFMSISNLIKWIPVIWKDRNWDDAYIYDILQFKIFQQRKYLVKHNRSTSTSANNRDMTICLNLIEKTREDWYSMEYLDYQKSEFTWEDLNEEEEKELKEDDLLSEKEKKLKLSKMNINILEDNRIDYINKYPNDKRKALRKHPELIDYLDNEENLGRLAFFMSNYRQEKAKNLLFKVLSYKMEGWWD